MLLWFERYMRALHLTTAQHRAHTLTCGFICCLLMLNCALGRIVDWSFHKRTTNIRGRIHAHAYSLTRIQMTSKRSTSKTNVMCPKRLKRESFAYFQLDAIPSTANTTTLVDVCSVYDVDRLLEPQLQVVRCLRFNTPLHTIPTE